MIENSKQQNFDKVRQFVQKNPTKSFTNYEIQQKFGLNYSQTKKILISLVELNELKFSDSLKIYVRVESGCNNS